MSTKISRANVLKVCLPSALVLAAAACGHRGVTPIRTHFNKGVYHYSEGDFDAAIREYRLALEEEPGDHRARFNLAEALEAKATRLERGGARDEAEELRRAAEEHYRALLAERPHDLRASVNLAARERQRGDGEAAEARLRAAIERYPRSALPRVALAAHCLQRADAAAAVELLEGALRLDPTNVDANMLLGDAYATLARAGTPEPGSGARQRDHPDPDLLGRARRAYGRALEHDASDLATLMALARLERLAGKPEPAEQWLRRALYVQPGLPEAHLLLAEVLEAQGDLEGATLHLWRSRQLEDERRPRLAPEEYTRRLLDLYRRLAERERRRTGG